ncbi:MAG: type I phosphomannose isomerase catalytic subunit, partial [Candidatus Fonsibacter sp.]
MWGKVNGLSKWNTNTDKPQAELWFGDHESSPSILIENNKTISSKSSFPLLVKILCAAEPLSIQVHPDKETAQEKYEQYALSDSHGKDEMLFALEHFLAYAGIRNAKKVQEIFKILVNDSKLDSLKDLLDHSSFKKSAQIIFNLSKDEITKANKTLKINLASLNISL